MIYVMSREEVINFYKENPDSVCPVISINDIGYDSPVPENHPKALRLYFDDVTPFEIENDLLHPYHVKALRSRSLVLFTDEMARSIVSFVKAATKDYIGEEIDLIVHCYAGVSRSVAVALALYNSAPDVFNYVTGFDFNNCRMNPYVFGKLCKEIF